MRPASVSLGAGVTGPSAWLPIDAYTDSDSTGLFVKLVSSGTYNVEVTSDNVFDPTVTATAYALPAPFAAATVSAAGGLLYAAKAVRLNATANAGGMTLTAMAAGAL